jgi:hypothetical protein
MTRYMPFTLTTGKYYVDDPNLSMILSIVSYLSTVVRYRLLQAFSFKRHIFI